MPFHSGAHTCMILWGLDWYMKATLILSVNSLTFWRSKCWENNWVDVVTQQLGSVQYCRGYLQMFLSAWHFVLGLIFMRGYYFKSLVCDIVFLQPVCFLVLVPSMYWIFCFRMYCEYGSFSRAAVMPNWKNYNENVLFAHNNPLNCLVSILVICMNMVSHMEASVCIA